jgi:tetratricopeptide (TPR) repeat protein
LRHLGHPNRLKQNQFAAAYFAESASTHEADLDVLRRLKRSISSALAQLTPRQRIIIEQCDLAGELNSTVARRLSISEGYFYRERQRALSVIGRHLAAGSHAKHTAEVLPDAFTVAMAQVAVLEQIGDAAHAIDVLERITPNLGEVDQRTLAHCRLAELYSTEGIGEKAVEHCETASTLAHQAGLQQGAQLDVAAASALAQASAGNEVAAESVAGTLLVPLRGAIHNCRTTTGCESFIEIALFLAEREIEHGRPQVAIRLCDEALSVLRSDDKIRRIWEYRIFRWRTAARCHSLSTMRDFARAVDHGVGELQDLQVSALQAGQIAEAIISATQLAALHRIMHRADRAIEALTPLLITVTDARAESLAPAFLELAAANVKAGRLAEASRLIQRVQKNPRAPAFAHGLSLQLEAEVALRSGSAERALRSASEAVEKMSSLRRFRGVGSALRYQALAFEALGNRGDALKSIALSTEYLREFGNVADSLQAEADEARLSGDRHRSLALAHKLSRARSPIENR